MARTIRDRAVALVLGTIAVLVALEVVLRVVGAIQVWQVRADARVEGDAEATILCLGDSYTHAPGVDRDQTYPAQLERMLNERAGDDLYRVVNRGQNGQNTRDLLDELEANLQLYQPRLVVLLAGGTNSWDYRGYHEFLHGEGAGSRARELLHRIRVYRLFRLAYLHATSRWEFTSIEDPGPDPVDTSCSAEGRNFTAEGHEHLAQADYPRAIASYEAALEECPLDGGATGDLGLVYLETHDYDQARIHLERAVELAPDRTTLYDRLARAYENLGRLDEAVDTLVRGLQTSDDGLNPAEKERILNHALGFSARGDSPAHQRAAERFEAATREDPELGTHLDRLEEYDGIHAGVRDWVAADIETAVRTCRGHGAGVVLMNYPHEYPSGWWEMYEGLARELELPFVDNLGAFQAHPSSQDLFFPDRHCNAEGNEVIARAAVEVVEGEIAGRQRSPSPSR